MNLNKKGFTGVELLGYVFVSGIIWFAGLITGAGLVKKQCEVEAGKATLKCTEVALSVIGDIENVCKKDLNMGQKIP